MLKTMFFYVLVYLLIVYGALSLITCAFDSVMQKVNGANPGIKLALMASNQEEAIEGIVRNVFMGDFLRKVMCEGKLIVIDMGSQDKTFDILLKLKNDYGKLEVLEEGEKDKIFTYFKTDRG